jgi:hypothetical protein
VQNARQFEPAWSFGSSFRPASEGYRPRIPEKTVLHKIMRENLEDVNEPREIPFGGPFEAVFTLGVPENREHWLEISCPQHEVYRSDVFLTPSKETREIDLKRIMLKRRGS